MEFNDVRICSVGREKAHSNVLQLYITYKHYLVTRLNYQSLLETLFPEIDQISAFTKSKIVACKQYRNEMLFIVRSYISELNGPELACALIIKSEYFNPDFLARLDKPPELQEYISIKAIPQPEEINTIFDTFGGHGYSCELLRNTMFVSFAGYNHKRHIWHGYVYYAHKDDKTFGDFRKLDEMIFEGQFVSRIFLQRKSLESATLKARNSDWKKICAGRVDTEVLKMECRKMMHEGRGYKSD